MGLNSILGYTQSFSGNYVCRWCRAHRDVLRVLTREDQSLLRDADNYQADLHKNNPSGTGVRQESVLNSLHFFHVTDNVTPDIMHDILEGVGSHEFKLIINSLIEEKHLSLDTLNYRISSFDYGFSDKRNQPTLISKSELRNPDGGMRQSASQMWCLLRLLPLMIGDLIPLGNKYWNLLLLLLQCMEFIFSPSITPGATIFLAYIIQEHHSLFLELYPHLHLRPKHHFMLHYPRAIMKLGPIVHFWAMHLNLSMGFSNVLAKLLATLRTSARLWHFATK